MQLKVPAGIDVSLGELVDSIRFTSTDEDLLCDFAKNFAQRRGLQKVGAIRLTYCPITPMPGNFEPDLGVPSAHLMVLVSHHDLAFAGDREPMTTTVYKTLIFVDDNPEREALPRYTYHFTAALA